MEQVRLGIIGVGNMGSGHTANIMAGKVPEVRITAAADLRESRSGQRKICRRAQQFSRMATA